VDTLKGIPSRFVSRATTTSITDITTLTLSIAEDSSFVTIAVPFGNAGVISNYENGLSCSVDVDGVETRRYTLVRSGQTSCCLPLEMQPTRIVPGTVVVSGDTLEMRFGTARRKAVTVPTRTKPARLDVEI
jgi:hypothetical protein